MATSANADEVKLGGARWHDEKTSDALRIDLVMSAVCNPRAFPDLLAVIREYTVTVKIRRKTHGSDHIDELFSNMA